MIFMLLILGELVPNQLVSDESTYGGRDFMYCFATLEYGELDLALRHTSQQKNFAVTGFLSAQ